MFPERITKEKAEKPRSELVCLAPFHIGLFGAVTRVESGVTQVGIGRGLRRSHPAGPTIQGKSATNSPSLADDPPPTHYCPLLVILENGQCKALCLRSSSLALCSASCHHHQAEDAPWISHCPISQL